MIALFDLTADEIKDFWSRVKKTDNCWEWQTTRYVSGYGRFAVRGKELRAHRVSYRLTYGNILDNYFICHKCDNPCCVRPDHLFEGTHTDNMRDRVQKKRYKIPGTMKGMSSKYRGVSFPRKNEKRWRCRYKLNHKENFVGYFDTEVEAAQAYDDVMKVLNPTLHDNLKRPLNFPQDA